MKNNLTALLRRATIPLIPLGFLLLSLVLLGGCSSQPTSVERFLFDVKTNEVARVSITTNTVGGIATIAAQTNIAQEVIWTVKPTVTTVSNIGAGIVDNLFPGIGKLALILLTGFLSLFGLNRQRKLTEAANRADVHYERANTANAVAQNFAQSIEVLREILKTTPQGQALDLKIVDMLQRHQLTAGIIREAVSIVGNTVNNDAAKSAAGKILALLPPQPA